MTLKRRIAGKTKISLLPSEASERRPLTCTIIIFILVIFLLSILFSGAKLRKTFNLTKFPSFFACYQQKSFAKVFSRTPQTDAKPQFQRNNYATAPPFDYRYMWISNIKDWTVSVFVGFSKKTLKYNRTFARTEKPLYFCNAKSKAI